MAEANPFTLSGGEKRRLSVGTALAARPRVLVLDEPTFGQDAITWARLVRLLGELMAEGTAVVSVTHDLDFAAPSAGGAWTWVRASTAPGRPTTTGAPAAPSGSGRVG
ncbi:hypothetical protein A5N15_05060 [Rothia kristinae]|uniref:ABC transporter domain-containing protein n=1 Tax=Rothia kristinae TaxID=37923 RepID=A0A657IVE7_9MICC|nr:hypothetical protein A5N15_05060 [Rothia kristinae]